MDPVLVNIEIRRGVTWGGMAVTCRDDAGALVNLTGWSAIAQIRDPQTGDLIHDLAPAVLVGTDGVITIPEIPWGTTLTMGANLSRNFVWDMLPIDPDGRRYDPVTAGNVTMRTTTSH